ncbi:MFS transporter [Brachybacterium huguangmaarense]
MTGATAHRLRSRLAIIALGLSLFTYLTAEVFVAGALGPMSRDLGVSAAATGALTSVYAIVAAIAILPVSAVTRRLPVRVLLPSAMLVLAITSAVCALADSLPTMMLARCAAALFHGVVWASVPAVAAWIAPGSPGRATASVFVGASAGSVLGAPSVAAVAEVSTWRAASAALAVLAVVCTAALAVSLPPGRPEPDAPTASNTPRRRTGWPPGTGRIVMWCGLVVLVAAAHLAAFTYVSEIARAAGLGASLLPGLLLAMGAAGLASTLVAGRLHDRHPRAVTPGTLAVLVVAFAVVAVSVREGSPGALVVGAVAWSASYTAQTVSMQASVLDDAPGWGRRASAWYVLAFQVGIALGAAGGGALSGAMRPGAAGASAALALLVVTLGTWHSGRDKTPRER